MRVLFSVLALIFLVLTIAAAQDIAVVDAEHTKVVFENDEVRVLRFSFPPGTKQVMHDHPDHVIVILTDQQGRSTTPDGQVKDVSAKAGYAGFRSAYKHTFENTGTTQAEGLIVELKCKPEAKATAK